jgi:O-antigen/teichoic acid export membrane protein
MNIKQALLHNTGWKIITMLFTFLNNIIIVRLLGVEVSANFFYTLAIFAFIGTLLRFGLENGIVYYATKNEQKIGTIALFVLFVTIAQTGITFFVLKYFIKLTTVYSLCWSILFVIGNVLLYYITAFYQVKRMYVSINAIGTLIAFIQTICLAIIYFFKHNFILDFGLAKSLSDTVLFVLSVGLFIQMVWLVVYFYKSNRFSFVQYKIENNLVKNLFNY